MFCFSQFRFLLFWNKDNASSGMAIKIWKLYTTSHQIFSIWLHFFLKFRTFLYTWKCVHNLHNSIVIMVTWFFNIFIINCFWNYTQYYFLYFLYLAVFKINSNNIFYAWAKWYCSWPKTLRLKRNATWMALIILRVRNSSPIIYRCPQKNGTSFS